MGRAPSNTRWARCGVWAGCATLACASGSETHISGPELLARIDAGTAPPIIDVRTRGEYESGHVPGAIHVPFLATFTRGDEIEAPRDAPIVVYCEHGPRAGVGKLGLSSAGFERILYLEGHMSGWKKAGLPIEVEPPGDEP
jgi:rhodanese-related sulfurtransferase